MYLAVDPWFTAQDVTLHLQYFDSGAGRVGVRYDSLDASVTVDPRFPGAFKGAGEPIECRGTQTWQHAALRLPDARLARCSNGADIRLELDLQGDFPLRAVWITANTDGPPLPMCSVGIVQPDGTTAWREARVDEQFVLQSGNYSQTLTPMGPAALQDVRVGVSLIAPGKPLAPVGFDVRKAPGDGLLSFAVAAMPVRMRVFGGARPSAVEYEWGFEGSFQVKIRVEAVDDELIAWRLTVSDRPGSPLSIINTGFAGLWRLKVGDALEDDWFVCPGYAGHGAGVWYNPAAAQPGGLAMAMNWLAAYDGRAGVGMLLDDPGDHDVYCQAIVRDGAIDTHFMLQGPLAAPIAVYHLVHGGDWHHVADVYRKRVADRDPRPLIPAWAQDCDGWDGAIGNEIEHGFSVMPHLWEKRYAPNGLTLLDVYRAMCDGPWSYCGVYPYPCPWYGSAEELREANQRLRDHGYRTIYYINYQLSMPDGPDVRRIGPCAKALLPEGLPAPFAGIAHINRASVVVWAK
jgi:hypothetical protein